MPMLSSGQFLLGVAATLAVAEIEAQEFGQEVQRLPIRRKQRHKHTFTVLGVLPRSNEVPAPDDAQPTVLDFSPGVANIRRVRLTNVTDMTEVKPVHGANVSSIMEFTRSDLEDLTDIEDVMYTMPVQLGTPLRSAELILDTGSSDFWLKPPREKHSGYSTRRSETFQGDHGTTFNVEYGQGKISGYMGSDRYCMHAMCLDEEHFIVTTSVDDMANDDFYDGLLGLGFPKLASCSACSMVNQVLKAEVYQNFAFGLTLKHDAEESYIEFGELKQLMDAASETFGDHATVPLYGWGGHAEYWMTQPQAIQAGNAVVHGQVYTVLDSGTSFLTVPGAQHKKVWRNLLSQEARRQCSDKIQGGGGRMLCVCGTRLNPLSFFFEDSSGDGPQGHQLNITLGPTDLLDPIPIGSLTDGREVCRVTFVIGPEHMNFWLLGDVFLRHVYAVHDVDHVKMHLYPRSGVDTHSPAKYTHTHPSDRSTQDRDSLVVGSSIMVLILASCCCFSRLLTRQPTAQAQENDYTSLLG